MALALLHHKYRKFSLRSVDGHENRASSEIFTIIFLMDKLALHLDKYLHEY